MHIFLAVKAYIHGLWTDSIRLNGCYCQTQMGHIRILQPLSQNEYLNAPEQIKTTTRIGMSRHVEIKWFDDFIGMGIIFCNPEESSGWVQIESSIPFIEAANKHVIHLEKCAYPEFYRKLYDAYKKMWDESRVPKPEEYQDI